MEEAFAARRRARRLLVVPERRASLDQLVLHATTLRIPVLEVEGGSLTALTGFDGHQGIALITEARRWATLEEIVAAARAAGEPPLVLVLDHLEDPQNVGTLLRSAEAVGVHGVLFPVRRAAPIGPAAVKASAGAIEHLRLVPVEDLAAAVADLHALGVRVVGADEKAALALRDADLRGPLAIVVGSEGQGIEARLRRRLDLVARIPVRGRVASLNASVAGSVFLFEAAAQRGLGTQRVVEGEAGGPPGVAAGPDGAEAGSRPAEPESAAGPEDPEGPSAHGAPEAPAHDGSADPEDDALLPESPLAHDPPADQEAGPGRPASTS